MCGNGTCPQCIQAKKDGGGSARWQPKRKQVHYDNKNGNEGDQLHTGALDLDLIRKMLEDADKGKEGGGKKKEQG